MFSALFIQLQIKKITDIDIRFHLCSSIHSRRSNDSQIHRSRLYRFAGGTQRVHNTGCWLSEIGWSLLLFRMQWLSFVSHLNPSPNFVLFTLFVPYLITNPNKFLFIGEPSGFDSIQSLTHCLGVKEAIKNNRQTNHTTVEQRSGFY